MTTPMFYGSNGVRKQTAFQSVPFTLTSAFSIVALVKTSANQNIASFSNTMTDGIWYASGRIYFAVKFSDTSVTTVSLPVDEEQAHFVVASFDGESVSLFVDGDYDTVPVTTSSTPTLGPTLYVGSDGMLLSTIGYFAKPLRYEQLFACQSLINPGDPRQTVVANNGGALLYVNNQNSDLVEYRLDENPVSAQTEAFYVTGNDLVASMVSGLTIGGTYEFTVPVETSLGFAAGWDSNSLVTMEYSIDNTNYLPLNRDVMVQVGTTLAQTVAIRATVPAGQTAAAFVKNLVISYVASSTMSFDQPSAMSIVTSGTVNRPSESRPFFDMPGYPTTFPSGTIIANPDVDGTLTYAVDFWYTPTTADMTGTHYLIGVTGSTAVTISSGTLTRTGFSAGYVNGVNIASGSFTPTPGVAFHFLGVYTTAHANQIVFGDPTNPPMGNMHSLGIYASTFDAAGALTHFNAQIGKNLASQSVGTSAFTDNPVSSYQKVWTS